MMSTCSILHSNSFYYTNFDFIMNMHIKHEKLPKDARPEEGGTYTLLHQGVPVYAAEILKYGGGCWATVRVTEALDATLPYNSGDTFDIRVAMYEFSA